MSKQPAIQRAVPGEYSASLSILFICLYVLYLCDVSLALTDLSLAYEKNPHDCFPVLFWWLPLRLPLPSLSLILPILFFILMPFPISLSSAVGSPGVSPGGRNPPLVNKQVEMSDSTGVITHSIVFAVCLPKYFSRWQNISRNQYNWLISLYLPLASNVGNWLHVWIDPLLVSPLNFEFVCCQNRTLCSYLVFSPRIILSVRCAVSFRVAIWLFLIVLDVNRWVPYAALKLNVWVANALARTQKFAVSSTKPTAYV